LPIIIDFSNAIPISDVTLTPVPKDLCNATAGDNCTGYEKDSTARFKMVSSSP